MKLLRQLVPLIVAGALVGLLLVLLLLYLIFGGVQESMTPFRPDWLP